MDGVIVLVSLLPACNFYKKTNQVVEYLKQIVTYRPDMVFSLFSLFLWASFIRFVNTFKTYNRKQTLFLPCSSSLAVAQKLFQGQDQRAADVQNLQTLFLFLSFVTTQELESLAPGLFYHPVHHVTYLRRVFFWALWVFTSKKEERIVSLIIIK